MLAMTGTLRVNDARSIAALRRRLHSYQTVRVSETQRVVLIPPIGSFLVDWDARNIRLHIAGNSRRDVDELMQELNAELRSICGLVLVWEMSAAVPAPLR